MKPRYSDASPVATGFEILNACFDAAFARDPRLFALGEDVGRLGDVNQGFAHLQEKYGELRVSDTGIREVTIVGQAIGMALRGLRPIAEIQYLDYLLYALQIMSDDLASLRWRTAGGQKAPLIIRTRGHRLEGIWHAGSPMAGVINLLRGIYVCVPRDAVQAAGFYNTMLRSDDPALIVEVLNAYRRRAKVPDNIAEMTIPLGVPEVIREGGDVTIVTYGACCAIAPGGGGASRRRRDRDRGDRRAHAAAVRPGRQDRRVDAQDQSRPLPRRGRSGRRFGLHDGAGARAPGRVGRSSTPRHGR